MQEENRMDIVSDRKTKAFSFYMNTEGILAESEQDVVTILLNISGDDVDDWIFDDKQETGFKHGKGFYYFIENPILSKLRFEYNPNTSYSKISWRLPTTEFRESLDDITRQDSFGRIGSASHSLVVGSTLVDAQYAVEVRTISSTDIERQILEIFQSGEGEIFEDGMESNFSRLLSSFIQKQGKSAISEIDHIVRNGLSSDDVISEVLSSLARLDDTRTYNYRRWLLEKTLESESFYMRDAATMGLSFMDDKHSIAALEKAIAREVNKELRVDMLDVLEQFRG